MKVYRIIVIVFVIILGIAYSTLLFFSTNMQTAIKDPVTEEYYEYLKENALKVSKALDISVLNDETLTADFYFSKTELVVTVESFKAKVTAKIPISNKLLNVEDDIVKTQEKLEFENVKYEEKRLLQSVWYYIILMITGGIFVPGMLYILLYGGWVSYPKKK